MDVDIPVRDSVGVNFKTIIECGVPGESTRILRMHSEFFGCEVDVFLAQADERKQVLFRSSDVARQINIRPSRLSMYLSRSEKRGTGIFQAVDFLHKSVHSRLKLGTYFVSEEVCYDIKNHFANVKKRQVRRYGSESSALESPAHVSEPATSAADESPRRSSGTLADISEKKLMPRSQSLSPVASPKRRSKASIAPRNNSPRVSIGASSSSVSHHRRNDQFYNFDALPSGISAPSMAAPAYANNGRPWMDPSSSIPHFVIRRYSSGESTANSAMEQFPMRGSMVSMSSAGYATSTVESVPTNVQDSKVYTEATNQSPRFWSYVYPGHQMMASNDSARMVPSVEFKDGMYSDANANAYANMYPYVAAQAFASTSMTSEAYVSTMPPSMPYAVPAQMVHPPMYRVSPPYLDYSHYAPPPPSNAQGHYYSSAEYYHHLATGMSMPSAIQPQPQMDVNSTTNAASPPRRVSGGYAQDGSEMVRGLTVGSNSSVSYSSSGTTSDQMDTKRSL